MAVLQRPPKAGRYAQLLTKYPAVCVGLLLVLLLLLSGIGVATNPAPAFDKVLLLSFVCLLCTWHNYIHCFARQADAGFEARGTDLSRKIFAVRRVYSGMKNCHDGEDEDKRWDEDTSNCGTLVRALDPRLPFRQLAMSHPNPDNPDQLAGDMSPRDRGRKNPNPAFNKGFRTLLSSQTRDLCLQEDGGVGKDWGEYLALVFKNTNSASASPKGLLNRAAIQSICKVSA